MTDATSPLSRPITAGIVTALVGFTSSFAVVLTGLDAVGATAPQATSGLIILSLTMGIACIVLAWRYRMPITVAWSTPGAALLAATGAVEGGWSAVIGAFLVVAALTLLAGLWPGFGRLIARIPASIAQAMLAGVLLPLCLAPITGLAENPWGVLPILITWLIFMRLAPRWATPLAFVAAAVVITVELIRTGAPLDAGLLIPRIELTMPTFTVGALVGVALPLFIVTMASQNVPGVAIMRSFEYEVPWRPAMLVTGIGTALGAPAGGHGINLAAISAALAASPEADPDARRRWVAGASTGVIYIMLGGLAAAFSALVILAPAAVIPAVAGVALFTALGSAIHQAVAEPGERMAAVVTFLIAASGLAIAGVSAAFWALAAGLLVRAVLTRRR
ncbi:benzoate/H(+) symporter BenE family transporter [Microbacterium sp. A204]|uniref:benzoate/H(+) symporter BenE family transporter n=1 Tax=Microbacterium sp. A204 TaxID=3457321 RepID=UPI003FCF4E0C